MKPTQQTGYAQVENIRVSDEAIQKDFFHALNTTFFISIRQILQKRVRN